MTDFKNYSKELESSFHKTIKKVTLDIEALKFNTAIAAIMTLLNEIYDKGSITKGEMKALLIILNPFIPQVTEELWEMCGFDGLLANAAWCSYDEEKCKDSEIEIVIQICGKIRERIMISANSSSEEAIEKAKSLEKIAEAIKGKTIVKEIYVSGKLVNIVVK